MVIVRFKDTLEVVFEFETMADFQEAFPNGFDADNEGVFEAVVTA